MKKCKCCNRESNDLRFGFCFDCANSESIIVEGMDMYDNPIEKKEGMSKALSKLQEILKLYNVYKN